LPGALLDCANKIRRFQQQIVSASVEPCVAAP
jgi:hypothetical protein